MTLDVSIEVLIGAALFTGGQIAMLAATMRSNRSQGRRLGKLEQWRTAHDAVRDDRRRRGQRSNDTRGIIVNDEDSDPGQ